MGKEDVPGLEHFEQLALFLQGDRVWKSFLKDITNAFFKKLDVITLNIFQNAIQDIDVEQLALSLNELVKDEFINQNSNKYKSYAIFVANYLLGEFSRLERARAELRIFHDKI